MKETRKNKQEPNNQSVKVGLVLEGGAMRGMFTCGVIDVLLEQNVMVDGAIGVSAGAAFGCNYKSKQVGRPIRYNKRFCNDKRYVGIGSLLKTGNLYNEKFCYHRVPEELDPFDSEAFVANPMDFYVVACNAKTGESAYHLCFNGLGEDIEWIRASASMPMVSKPVKIGKEEYLDGGMTDPIPVRKMEALGYDNNLVVLTRPRDYQKPPFAFTSLLHILLRKYPAMITALSKRHQVYNETLAYIREREKKGAVYVISPPEDLKIGKVEKNPAELERVYQIGRKTAMDQIENIKEYINEHTNRSDCE